MERSVTLNGEQITYKHNRTRRAKRMTITVKHDASVLVTTPRSFPIRIIEHVMKRQADWILKQIEKYKDSPYSILHRKNPEEYERYKEKALRYLTQKVEKMNQHYGFSYNKISVRNQTTMWGSCSEKGNLSFNYKLYFLPDYLAEYVVVHELCHLQELNHSQAFWDLVAKVIPEWEDRVKELGTRF